MAFDFGKSILLQPSLEFILERELEQLSVEERSLVRLPPDEFHSFVRARNENAGQEGRSNECRLVSSAALACKMYRSRSSIT